LTLPAGNTDRFWAAGQELRQDEDVELAELDCEILIVGAGLSGIGAAIQLKKSGFTNMVILEKSTEVGGTWRDNTYPGLTVDVPTIYYSFSFEQNSEWSSFYARQIELFDYCRGCTDKHGIRRYIRFGKAVAKSEYDEAKNHWTTHLEDGESYTSKYLVSGTGLLSVPRWPDIEGISTFAGRKMHTTEWDRDCSFAGKRVGFIGTGATGVQVIPELAPEVAQLDVYQRTPTWILPKPDKPIGRRLRWALRHIPGFQHLFRLAMIAAVDIPLWSVLSDTHRVKWLQSYLRRMAERKLREEVPDPDLRERLAPKFAFGCRRPTFSNKYFPTFNRKNVDLITTPIQRITANSIVTADGRERDIDILVCATGFRAFHSDTVPTFPVYGRGGRELTDFWAKEKYQTFKGVTVANYPNYFMIFGPYSISSLSYISMIETSVRHMIRVLKEARRREANYVEVKTEAQAKYVDRIFRRVGLTIWTSSDCTGSGSLEPGAANPALSPNNYFTAWLDSHVFRLSNYSYG
jgi:cation diffusion facilitator CzcD-associated flavoprotein CzcO